MKKFDNRNTQLLNQFENIEWIENSGLDLEDLLLKYNQLMEQEGILSKAMLKAKTFELLANHARIAIDKDDIFEIFGNEYDGRKISLKYFIDLCVRHLEVQRYCYLN